LIGGGEKEFLSKGKEKKDLVLGIDATDPQVDRKERSCANGRPTKKGKIADQGQVRCPC